ncbi:MAG TPA: nitroreductase family deazaflavin-dependent oxidoreductase [Ktedonobacterales bacterium]
MAKTYRVTFFVRLSNKIVELLLRAGVKITPKRSMPMILLTVRGRKSGQPRTTPVVLVEQDGRRLLVGSFGQVNWVRNLRAAGEATLTRGRRSEAISVVELPSEEAAPLLKQILSTAPGFISAYFDVTPDSPLEDFVREAPRHPLFEVYARAPEGQASKEEAVR